MAEPTEDEKKDETKPDAKPDDGLGDAGKRALDSERKARRDAEGKLKKAEDQLEQLKRDGDSSKSEMEKVREQITKLEKRAEEAELKVLRAEIAQKKNLPPALARWLHGASREELEANADELLEAVGKKSDGAKPDGESKDGAKPDGKDDDKSPFGKPREILKSGASNEGDQEPDPEKLAESILKSKSF